MFSIGLIYYWIWYRVSVRLGEYNTDTEEDCVTNLYGTTECTDQPQDILIDESIVHEQYKPNDVNQYHDIALLRLRREVPYTGQYFISC